MTTYPMILDRVVNTPLLAHPAKAELVAGVVLRRAGVDVAVESNAAVFVDAPQGMRAGPLQERRMAEWQHEAGGKPFLFDPASGLAVIEITGSLAHRQWHIGRSSGVTGYDGIGAQLDAALADGEVRAILLDIHSPGGEVAGAFTLADRIAAARLIKPVVAVADEMALSGAYLLAAAAREVWLAAATAEVGSIGVCMVHVSFEQMLAAEGIRPTILKAGAQKDDGNPYTDLPAEVAARLQYKIDTVYDLFVARVAAWRPLAAQEVRATEAGILMGSDAVDLGLADGIAAPAHIFDALSAEVAGRLVAPALRAI